MKRIILAVNAGSSSVKISVYSAEKGQAPEQLAEAQVSGITAPPPKLSYSRHGETVCKGKVVDQEAEVLRDEPSKRASTAVISQDAAFRVLLRTLIDDEGLPQIGRKEDVAIVCHRIVHGGDFAEPQLIGPETYHRLEALTELAPLHNSAALEIVHGCLELLPAAANVACFDSAFHASLPLHVRAYPIDQDVAIKNGLRKYGFHGLSYAYITRAVSDFLRRAPSDLSIIALHLGSGASACAIQRGHSVDTSMGLTPLAGLPGATRSGSVDPSLVFHYASDPGRLAPMATSELHISRAEEILNREAGWKALAGTTDFAEIARDPAPSEGHALAFDLFVDRVCAFVGSYYVSLGGDVDALVFAGGIGERSARLRAAVAAKVACLGFAAADDRRNNADLGALLGGGATGDHSRSVADVGVEGAPHRTLVCVTDEQFEMARTCAEDERLW